MKLGNMCYEGKSMACVNKYIQDKHLGIVVPAIETAVNNFMIVENAYFMEMYDIENKSGSIIEEEHLEIRLRV